MRDQFERNINYMRVSVTDRCNLRCVYCMPKDGVQQISHDEILTFDEIARVCRIGAELGISRIKLTGGEPLVRKGIEDLAEMICRIPGIEQVTLTTNGILLKDKLPALKKAGISAVNISLDTNGQSAVPGIDRKGLFVAGNGRHSGGTGAGDACENKLRGAE